MKGTNRFATCALPGAAAFFLAIAAHAEMADDKIARAMTAAPANITENATVLDLDGTVLREGTNEWVCFPGVPLIPDDTHPMCNDAVWMAWLKAVSSDGDFATDVMGVSYMLAGDAMVNNADPMARDQTDGGMWIQEGPHLMLLLPDKAMVATLSRDPYAGGPYVMWADTPLWHVMAPIEAQQPPQ
ncbi:hypothetical protein LCGC14_2254010 [marine sediment metagenome]|uniref:Uncharacterized protein n=1 Tax=marine sediment metagenome TaxID=412755 RepID=A0A0F9FWN1_9ZZZZ